ncbi:hypothetical protein [Wolbachia endosymbiont (group E) of Neria commutata]|uniref:hypothetical protein n=1 Tax=Wolbachia endosymbiont (group E) of Neria commutata TaxID=3066149 RepID=UPI00313350A8
MDNRSTSYFNLWLRSPEKNVPIPNMYCDSTPTEDQAVPARLLNNAFVGISADPNTMNDSDQNYESFDNYPAFIISSTNDQIVRSHVKLPRSVVLECSAQVSKDIESGPSAMLWSVNNQQHLSGIQPSGSLNRNNGF